MIDYKDIRKEDIPRNLHQLVEIVGIEKTVDIIQAFGGSRIWISALDSVERLQRYRKIREEYNGTNQAEMAKKYGIPERTFRYIISAAKEAEKDL